MALELIKISEFPESADPKDWIVVSDSTGVGYKISKENFKAFLGTVTVTAPRPIKPTDPAPTLDGVYIPEIDGTYANLGGIEVDRSEGGEDYGKSVTILKNGSSFVKVSEPYPQAENKIDTWEPGTYTNSKQTIWKGQIWEVNVASTDQEPGTGTDWKSEIGETVKNYNGGIGKIGDAEDVKNLKLEIDERGLPVGVSLNYYDRPDLNYTTVVINENNLIISSDSNIKEDPILIDDYDRPDLGNGMAVIDSSNRIILIELYPTNLDEVVDYDRPDINIAYIDVNDKIISSSYNYKPKEPLSIPLYIPTESDGYMATDAPEVCDYNQILADWDGLVSSFGADYITKTEIGKSSRRSQPIYRYDFKPLNATRKVCLTFGIHGSEKVYIKQGFEFFKQLCEKWFTNEGLQYLRNNVHFVVIPVVSPDSIIGFDGISGTGGRRVLECEPFNVSWTKEGNIVTLTYSELDFPDTNGRLDAANYFGDGNIAGKIHCAIFDSSDIGLETGGYKIESVVDGKTITVNSSTSGSASGTAKLYVSTDPNRNQSFSNIWNNFNSQGPMTNFTNEADPAIMLPADNKGTKPYSLGESIAINTIIEEGGFDFFMDCHSGAGNNYLDWAIITENRNSSFQMKDASISISKGFGETQFSGVESNVVVTTPYTTLINELKYKLTSFAIEWSNPAVLNNNEATRALRWMFITVINGLKYK